LFRQIAGSKNFRLRPYLSGRKTPKVEYILASFFIYMEAQEDTIRETCGLLKEERRAVTNLAAKSCKAKQK